MSFSRSLKARFDRLIEVYPWLKPFHNLVTFFLQLRFKFVNASRRNWLLLQFVALRLRYGKKLVVIYRDVGIGDLVCTFPLINEIKKQFPGGLIVYVTHHQFRAFIEKFSGANVAIGTSYVLFSLPLPRVPAWVATKAFHPLYVNEGPGSPKGKRLGHVLEMAKSCEISLSNPRPHLTVDGAEALATLRRYDNVRNSRPYIGIHLGPTLPVKEWAFESWKRLVEMLSHQSGATIFQFGAKWHSSHPAELSGNLPVHCDLTNQLNLIETTQLISKMDLFIGIDSGLLHIAYAAGVPSIGLFGPTDPAIVMSGYLTAALFTAELSCIFCQQRDLNLHWKTGCPYNIRCMQSLSVDEVFAQSKKILEMTAPLENSGK